MELGQWIPDEFQGAVYLTCGEEVLFEEGFGWRNRADRLPNSCDTRFPTASAGKGFVAVGVLRLVEEERLALTDTLGSLLDIDYATIDPQITIAQLLSHTSGIPDYFDESVMKEYEELWHALPCYRMRRSADLLPLIVRKPMLYPRGERFQYNNAGFVVLGLVIEAIVKMPFDEFLEREVFARAEMWDTGYFETDRLPERCANAYIEDERGARTNIFCVEAKGNGAGGAFTTPKDMRAFWSALYAGKLLRPETVREMTRPQCAEGCYGYGIWIDSDRVHLEGCDPGVSFQSAYRPCDGTILTTVSNRGGDVWKLQDTIWKKL